VLRQVGDSCVTLAMRGPAVDVGFSSEWALLLRCSTAPPPSPIDYLKTPLTPFGDTQRSHRWRSGWHAQANAPQAT
jgi:hypothetical protein